MNQKSSLLDVLVIATIILVLGGGMKASSQVVTNAGDSGPGTLRAAIAGALSGATVTFATNLSGQTISLASVLTINTNLTIDASSLPGGIQINGYGFVGIFSVESGNTVVLNSLTIINGNSLYNDIGVIYGGIYNDGTLTLNQCTLSGNSAYDYTDEGFLLDGVGGGIYNDGTLTLSQCTLSGNSAVFGGGIYNNGALSVTQCDLSGNSASEGGGIVNNGTLSVTQCDLSGNYASDGGGVVNNSGATLTISNSALSGNYANAEGSAYSSAGGIANHGTLTVNKCTLSGNTASGGNGGNGGGVYNDGAMLMNECTMSENSAPNGGGIYNDGTSTLNQCTISDNSGGNGGGIHNNGTSTLNQCTISDNSGGNGGGIYNNTGTLTVNESTLSDNSASHGGGIDNGGMLTLFNSVVAGNSAQDILYEYDFSNFSPSSETLEGANIVESVYDATLGNATITGASPISAAPNLAPLGNYGGPTQTMPPLPGSPAIAAGSVASNTFTTDQRGYPRVLNGLIDIGAVELPTIQFTASPTNGFSPLSVQFASPSFDSDGSAITQRNWSFGDATANTCQDPTHVYTVAGSFSPSLTVTNSLGLTLAATGPAIEVYPPLTLIGISQSKTNVMLIGTNGVSGLTYSVLASTNLALPLSQWTPLATNTWSANGNFTLTVTNAMNPSVPSVFYRLEVQ